MKSKFAIRCATLAILTNAIVSENVVTFTTKSNTKDLEAKTGNITDKIKALSIPKVATLIIPGEFESDKNGNKKCADKGKPEDIIVARVFKDIDIKFHSKLSWIGDILFGSLLTVFSFLSFVGNSFALLVFLFRQRKLSSAEVFFINLAIVDILLSIASYPMSITAAFRHRWDFGQIGCATYGFVCYFLGVASICSVTSIAIIRYYKTCDPVRGNQVSCQTSCKILALGYLVAFVWATMPLVGFGSYEVEPYGLSCTLNWMANNEASKFYILLVTIFLVFVPLLTIIFCYSQIIWIVKKSNQKMKINCVNKRCMRRTDVQLTWISILITIGFVAAWSPYAVVCLYSSFWGESLLPMWATSFPTLFAKSAIILNPIIYIFFTERYRNDLINQVKLWLGYTKKLKRKQSCY